LGASSADLETFTEGVALALKVQGGDASSSAGALLQLSQALGGSIVRAEEFNSMLDGARPLLQSVANGLVEAGGSVSKLRQLVNDGKVSSAGFFRAFLSGMGDLKAQAATTTSTLGENFTRLTNSMTVLVGSLDRVAGASVGAGSGIGALSGAIDGLAADEDKLRTIVELFERLAGVWIGAKIGRVAGVPGAILGGTIGAFAPELLDQSHMLEDEARELNRIIEYMQAGVATGLLPQEALDNTRNRLAEIERQLKAVEAARVAALPMLPGSAEIVPAFTPASPTGTPSTTPVTLADYPARGGTGSGGGSSSRDAENRKIMETIADLEFEAAQLKRNAVDREINNRLRAAGVTLMSQEGQRIAELVRGNEAAAAAMKSVEEAQERVADASRQFADTAVWALDRVIVRGESLKDVLGDLARQLASSVLRSVLLGPAGAGGGIVGSLFGGARASGGPVTPGRAYLVGERGPELVVPRSAASVIPNHRIAGGTVSINSPITVNVAGGSQGPAADRDLADRVSSQVRNVVRQLFTEEMRTQMRPGGILNP
jgi:tape measure domain-containing protein